jgi:hypothetical protein
MPEAKASANTFLVSWSYMEQIDAQMQMCGDLVLQCFCRGRMVVGQNCVIVVAPLTPNFSYKTIEV